ncbi:alpha-amylase family glycosyl hydrolase [Flavobacteriaceae bacterium 14752]|uniref:alpha-amylase family glycosyl hydrolase n=1 Tax=Mesohalobacter salilacus TaxID=2491711 RepID=UPI000F63D5FB|nr:alpha-amlyase [Flavobacteriaceae bacterium 14752]
MKYLIYPLLICFVLLSCKKETEQKPKEKPQTETSSFEPISNDILESSVIYEANIRQYSKEGTLDAFTKDIPQLKELGVKVIWLMPVYPISMKRRKATPDLSIEDIKDPEEKKKYLGSYYAIADYTAINPNFGTLEDFEELVAKAHENDMYVILDWVANHTGFDHHWIEDHPEYYTKNKNGEITDPLNPDTGEPWGWTDVADLNYDNKELWDAMLNEMSFWVDKYNVDGFRCDVAGNVPTPFWDYAVPKLREIKPIFMLAESEDKDLFYESFEMGYNWEGHHIMNEIAQGKMNVKDWDKYMSKIDTTYQKDDYLMSFVTNHDENSWNGTVEERMGNAADAMIAFSYTIPGMPLIYSGLEYDLDHRLKFFEKDEIPKTKGHNWTLLEQLGELKNNNKALNGAKKAAPYKRLSTSDNKNIIAFKRAKNDDKVVYIANFSDEKQEFTLDYEGNFQSLIDGETVELTAETSYEFEPWQYWVLVQ